MVFSLGFVSQDGTYILPAVSWPVQQKHTHTHTYRPKYLSGMHSLPSNVLAFMNLGFSHGAVHISDPLLNRQGSDEPKY